MRYFALFLTGVLAIASSALGQIIVGTGPDSSYLVIEAPDNPEFAGGQPLVFEYRYDFATLPQTDGYGLLSAVASGVSELSFDASPFGPYPGFSTNYFLNSITYDGQTLATGDVNNYYWAQWLSGGEFWASPDFPFNPSISPDPQPLPAGTWAESGGFSVGYGMSAPFRYITPGSTDGWKFADNSSIPPTIAPIPEPSVWAMVLIGAVIGVWYARTRRIFT